MATEVLKTKKRKNNVKAHILRKSGEVPVVLFGRHMDNSEHLRVDERELTIFLNHHSTGSQATIKVGRKDQLCILKEVQRDVLTEKILHVSFQALTEGESIKVTIPIVIKGRDSLPADAVLQENLSELDIESLPKHLIEHVEVDVSKLEIGDSILVKDLEVFSDENIDVLSNPESSIVSISMAKMEVEEDTEEDISPMDVPLVGEEDSQEA